MIYINEAGVETEYKYNSSDNLEKIIKAGTITEKEILANDDVLIRE